MKYLSTKQLCLAFALGVDRDPYEHSSSPRLWRALYERCVEHVFARGETRFAFCAASMPIRRGFKLNEVRDINVIHARDNPAHFLQINFHALIAFARIYFKIYNFDRARK